MSMACHGPQHGIDNSQELSWARTDGQEPRQEVTQLASEPLTNSDLTLADQIERTGHALTADEPAYILAVSTITIFKQEKAGRIPSFRIGTCVRFDPRAVAQRLRSQ
jgi:hypothetical protein